MVSCSACFGSSKWRDNTGDDLDDDAKKESEGVSVPEADPEVPSDVSTDRLLARIFTYRELAAATKNFRPESFLGEGGFGRVYRGKLEKTGQEVAVKQLDKNGVQGNREFLVEVLILSLLHHSNLVNLVGYCADGDQRLLVYEYMPLGSLEDHLHDLLPGKEPLNWNTRMKIAASACKGLEYLHDVANPPVIYRDLKSSNILLDEGYRPKLSDFGLAKLGPVGDQTHVSTRVMGTHGYCAPEYAMTGQLTLKSDVYSFGVVLLEIITGRKAIDNTRPHREQNLVAWAWPMMSDRRRFTQLVDPLLKGKYPARALYQAVAITSMCLQENAALRPLIGDVATALTYIACQSHELAQAAAAAAAAAANQSSRLGSVTANMRERRSMIDSLDYPGSVSVGDSPDRKMKDHTGDASPDTNTTSSSSSIRSRWSPSPSKKPMARTGTRCCSDSDHSDQQYLPVVDSFAFAARRRTPRRRDANRERAVAEAKVWGENWRDKKRANSTGQHQHC